jgi:hypothetical protein
MNRKFKGDSCIERSSLAAYSLLLICFFSNLFILFPFEFRVEARAAAVSYPDQDVIENGGAFEDAVTIQLVNTEIPIVVVAGLNRDDLAFLQQMEKERPDSFRASLRVYLASDEKRASPLLGTVKLHDSQLQFEPRFALRAGVEYSACFDLQAIVEDNASEAMLSPATQVTLKVGDTESVAVQPKVVGVFPSGDQIPENLLRVYIQFDQAMNQGVAYDQIELLNHAGEVEAHPFLELPQELWDPSGTRFTLLFDPGRVKRDLIPRQELGPVLVSDREYTLVVKGTWKSAAGDNLRGEFRKQFHVSAPIETKVDTTKWMLQFPKKASRSDPLVIEFDRALDLGMLQRCIRIRYLESSRATNNDAQSSNGTGVQTKSAASELTEGRIEIGADEMSWTFVPSSPWEAGVYSVEVDLKLEDPCGNSLASAFEVNVEEKSEVHPSGESRSTDEVSPEKAIATTKTWEFEIK